MVYGVIIPLNTICIYFFSILFYFFSKHTFYFSYVTSLNFWDTNILFIFIFFLTFVFFYTKIFMILFTVFVFKISNFSQLIFFKHLILSLVIGTVVIHPVGFYVCTIVFMIKFFYKKRFLILSTTSFLRSTLVWLLSITLFLGSLWATQSASWGYFWVNDLVEWSLLFFIIYLLVYMHFYQHDLMVIGLFFLPLFLISFLIFLRFGFFSTRHNFITMHVTSYLIFLIYGVHTYFFNKKLKLKTTFVSFFRLKTVLISIILINANLITLKYFYFLIFIPIFSQKFSSYVKSFYTHLLFFSLSLVWLIFFNFFFLNYKFQFKLDFFHVNIYNSFIFGNLYYMFSLFGTQSLDIVNFFLANSLKSSYILVSKLYIVVLLNNLWLPYLIVFVLCLVKLVEFRFLYKKKTPI